MEIEPVEVALIASLLWNALPHIVALTPTKKDDAALPLIRKVVNVLAGNYRNAKNADKVEVKDGSRD